MQRSRKIMIFTTLAVLLTAGIAIAAWMVHGTGNGSGKAAVAQNLVVEAGTTTTGDLYPGATGGDIAVKVTNNNSFPVQLTDATVAGAVTPIACSVTVNSGPFDLSGAPVLGAGASADVTIPDALSMGSDAADSCQGLDLTITDITVNGQSN